MTIKKKFIRRNWNKFSKLGKKRRKKQVWRRAKGRDNKIREKRKGYPTKVMIGFKQQKNKKELILIKNLKDMEDIHKGKTVIIGKVGKKKRIEIMKKAKEKGIIISNINVTKMLKKAKKKESKKEIIKDIEKSGVSEKVAKAEEALDEKEQIKEEEK